MKIKHVAIIATFLVLSTGASADGQSTYTQSCAACHATGVAESPKLGDKAAWAPRIGKGVDSLVSTVITGKGAMPPKGACMGCSEADLKSAVEYMVSQSQ